MVMNSKVNCHDIPCSVVKCHFAVPSLNIEITLPQIRHKATNIKTVETAQSSCQALLKPHIHCHFFFLILRNPFIRVISLFTLLTKKSAVKPRYSTTFFTAIYDRKSK